MSRFSGWALVVAFLVVAGCGAPTKPVAVDITSPQKAILTLEEAYRCNNLEAALKCKDFDGEARLMLSKISPEMLADAEIVQKTAETLEMGFRAEVKKNGFPNFQGVTSTFAEPKPYRGPAFPETVEAWEIVESSQLPGGRTVPTKFVCIKRADGWKALVVVE